MEKEQTEKINAKENVHRIITEWKKRREQDEKEVEERFNSPHYQEVFKKLSEENEQRKKRLAAC